MTRKLKILVWIITTIVWFSLAGKVLAATYTVTKTADTNDGTCDADCSLREAIAVANGNAGNDEIDFNIPESDGGFVAASGDTQSYFALTMGSPVTVSDSTGVFINGYSQPGAVRNTAVFGQTINTILKIRLVFSSNPAYLGITGANNHLAGLNITNNIGVASIWFSANTSNNWIEGNFLGTDITGVNQNNFGTITYTGTDSGDIIGTNGDGVNDTGERNIIVNSISNNGALVTGTSSTNLVIAGNYFGVNKTSRTCLNGVRHQIFLSGASVTGARVGTNYDGVSDSEESNIFACVSAQARVEVRVDGTNGYIQGNYIGTNTYGDNLNDVLAEPGIGTNGGFSGYTIKGNVVAYNGSYGIWAGGGANNIVVQNIVHHNKGAGITITDSNGHLFSQNLSYSNTGPNIDINNNGVTANDAGDTDVGTNLLMNYPVINSVEYMGGGYYKLAGVLDLNVAESPFTIELCLSEGHSSGYGGCTQYLDSVVTSDYRWEKTVYVGDEGNNSHIFTATATNSLNDTSEYSLNITYNPPSQSSNSSSSDSRVGQPTCNDQVPNHEPDFFQVTAGAGSAIVYFSPVRESNYYFISYGLGSDAESYGVTYPTPYEDGVIFYQVNNLDPKTTYHFKVRAGNGCATGNWSRVLSVKTDAKKSKGGLIYYAYSKIVKKISGFKDLIRKI
jgi:CSLREA domain-containing protein